MDDIEAKTKALQMASVNFGAKVHEASGASTGPEAARARPSDEDVVDADFEEVDDEGWPAPWLSADGPQAMEPAPDPTTAGPCRHAHGSRVSRRRFEAELAETKDKLLRALAEQQNIRQQMQRQREEAVKFAASQLAGDLLDTLDNLQRAIESVPPEASAMRQSQSLLKGVEATEANLLATLARHGVQRIDPLGTAFDPHLHHAVLQRPDATAPEGTVVEVLQPGYMLHGRVLRPAMVGVAAPTGNEQLGRRLHESPQRLHAVRTICARSAHASAFLRRIHEAGVGARPRRLDLPAHRSDCCKAEAQAVDLIEQIEHHDRRLRR